MPLNIKYTERGTTMYKILKSEKLADKIYIMEVEAPRVAKHCQPGQFIIVKMDEKGERIPLTICDYDREKGTVTINEQHGIVGAISKVVPFLIVAVVIVLIILIV